MNRKTSRRFATEFLWKDGRRASEITAAAYLKDDYIIKTMTGVLVHYSTVSRAVKVCEMRANVVLQDLTLLVLGCFEFINRVAAF